LVGLDPTVVRARLAGRIVWGSARHFKGLERPVVLVLGFGDRTPVRSPEFYVAATRANYHLIVFADKRTVEALKRQDGGPSGL
jgi:hypothetical protein